jgi:hypothetical protein
MVVYTQDALAGATSKDAMEADIYLAVDQSNRSYINSNINQRLRLVHIAEVSYAEPSPPDTIRDRNRLQDKADGYVDNVPCCDDHGNRQLLWLLVHHGSGRQCLRGPRIRRGGTEMRNAPRRIQFRA